MAATWLGVNDHINGQDLNDLMQEQIQQGVVGRGGEWCYTSCQNDFFLTFIAKTLRSGQRLFFFFWGGGSGVNDHVIVRWKLLNGNSIDIDGEPKMTSF